MPPESAPARSPHSIPRPGVAATTCATATPATPPVARCPSALGVLRHPGGPRKGTQLETGGHLPLSSVRHEPPQSSETHMPQSSKTDAQSPRGPSPARTPLSSPWRGISSCPRRTCAGCLPAKRLPIVTTRPRGRRCGFVWGRGAGRRRSGPGAGGSRSGCCAASRWGRKSTWGRLRSGSRGDKLDPRKRHRMLRSPATLRRKPTASLEGRATRHENESYLTPQCQRPGRPVARHIPPQRMPIRELQSLNRMVANRRSQPGLLRMQALGRPQRRLPPQANARSRCPSQEPDREKAARLEAGDPRHDLE
mmetsp:Transcript_26675/g.68939  ORF Transcript_26675/g.68939 Transcript_26675/m.68939 type:complete len:308 (+) Transcript_26675:422-1345(+)